MGNYPETNIKNRRYKTCPCGFTGYGVRLFPYVAKGLCVTCWREETGHPVQIKVKDQWDRWANVEGNAFFKRLRRLEKMQKDAWDVWAYTKNQVLIGRRRINRSGVKKVSPYKASSWGNCFNTQMYKLLQQARHQEQDAWERKAYSWMRNLNTRRRVEVKQQVALS